jgi:hypothetical protein
MTNYPNSEKIMVKRIKLQPEIIKAVKEWKKDWFKGWKNLSNESKIQGLRVLNIMIWIKIKDKKRIPIIFEGSKSEYDRKKIIILTDSKNPSIISYLHEFAHFLLGPSELNACRWSTQLFQECFPKTFKDLKWEDHLLIKGRNYKKIKKKSNATIKYSKRKHNQ